MCFPTYLNAFESSYVYFYVACDCKFLLSMYYCFLHTYKYLTTSLRDGTGSSVQTEFSAQTTTMSLLKLFVKLFTAILLLSNITMQTNGSYKLQHTGANKVFSIHGRWKEHANQFFVDMQQTLNNHYHFYMEEDEYKNLFVDSVSQETLKPKALQLVNEWYYQAILDKLE